MTDNMRIWDALKKTDPRHTKEVGFGRKFTSIDAQWQLQRMTEQFGPVGEGWGYIVSHMIERLSDTMILAVADVEIWWGPRDEVGQRKSYGPIRATAELYAPQKDGKMRLDDDAPKKAMTDALTKGLSHLGVSADVFLGLFDDNKYVAKLKAEFSDKDWAEEAVRDGLAKDTTSTYDTAKATKAKTYADDLIVVLNTATKDEARQVWTENWKAPAGKKVSPLAWLETHAPDQFARVSQAHENAVA